MKCFKIESLEYGWFECRIGKYHIEASDYLGYDMPKELLSKLIKLLKGSSKERIYVMNEPGAGMIELSLVEDTVTISEYSINKPSFDLNTEIDEEIKNIEDCRFTVTLAKLDLIDAIVTDYSLYETGNGRSYYEFNWGEFPQNEYDELKRIAFEANGNLNEINSLQCTDFLKL